MDVGLRMLGVEAWASGPRSARERIVVGGSTGVGITRMVGTGTVGKGALES